MYIFEKENASVTAHWLLIRASLTLDSSSSNVETHSLLPGGETRSLRLPGKFKPGLYSYPQNAINLQPNSQT